MVQQCLSECQMLLSSLLLLSGLVSVWCQNTLEQPTTSILPTTPPPAIYGDHFRPYFFHEHPNICGRVPEWAVVTKNNAKVDYYDIKGGLSMIYLVEAWCGTCQSNAHIGGLLAKRWEYRYGIDVRMIAINRDNTRAKGKLRMMTRRLRPVAKWVFLLQDNELSKVWNTLSDYLIMNPADPEGDLIQFRSKRNDLYIVDDWGRIIRFLRDGILNRGRATGKNTQINWRDTLLNDLQLAKQGLTVCDELQRERLLCRHIDDWTLNGRAIRDLRSGTSLTIIVFIRADMEEFTTRGVLHDVLRLSSTWGAPRYVVIVDSVAASRNSFATVDLYKQEAAYADITLLLDENNSVASQYMVAPGDLIATDELGRIVGIFNRVDLSDSDTIDSLKDLHVNWNPDCSAFIDFGNAAYSTSPTGPTATRTPNTGYRTSSPYA